MAEENVQIVWRAIEWFNAGDPEAAQAHSTDDVVIVPLRAAMEGTTYTGPKAFASFGADSDEAWEELHFQAQSVRGVGQRVVAVGQLSARGRGTGADVNTKLAMLFEFRGALISELRTYMDVDEALEAAGLQE